MELLSGVTDIELRTLGIEALRRWRRRPPPKPATNRFGPPPPPPTPDPVTDPTPDLFSAHGDFGVELFKLLGERRSPPTVVDPQQVKEVLVDEESAQSSWLTGYIEFRSWLVRAGLAVDLQRDRAGNPIWFRLTRRGATLVDSDRDDDPLLPGYLDRVQARCPGLPDGVVALLVDARACMDHSLLRPAVVLMGVAYELVIEEVVDALITKNLLVASTADQKPAERIRRIKALIANPAVNIVLKTPDERTASAAAYDFADVLRLRRNEAAHTRPKHDFEHAGETEEFLTSAGRHLPALWALAV
jgi:hypothetical protein